MDLTSEPILTQVEATLAKNEQERIAKKDHIQPMLDLEQLLNELSKSQHKDKDAAIKLVNMQLEKWKMDQFDKKFLAKYNDGRSMNQGGYEIYYYGATLLVVAAGAAYYYQKNVSK